MKLITRHNYEEFFILYMDNELGSEDRRMVEAFVAQHPDLKEELDLLSHYKLEPDTSIVFNGKEELMKVNGETPVTLTNYEEWLLLYIDDELNAGQREAVEKFLSAHPPAQQQLDILAKTKLVAEPVIFDKSSLYRKEEKERPVIYWWKAAAAVLILAVGVTSIILSGRESRKNSVDIARTPVNQGNDNPSRTKPAEQRVSPVVQEPKETVTGIARVEKPVETNTTNVHPVSSNKSAANSTTAKYDIPKELPGNNALPGNKNESAIADNGNKPSNNLPQPENNLNNSKTNDAFNKAIAGADVPKEFANPNSLKAQDVTKQTASPSDIVQASNQELETSGKKTKLRGLFRKVARTFEKRTNIDPTSDDNKLLVAGLSFKLK